jgi:hypothetical protein
MAESHDVLIINQYNVANKNVIQSHNMLKHEIMTFMSQMCSTALDGNTAHSNFKQKCGTAKLMQYNF